MTYLTNKTFLSLLIVASLLLFGCNGSESIVGNKNSSDTSDTPNIVEKIYESNQSIPKLTETCTNIVDIEERGTIIKDNHYLLTFLGDDKSATSSMAYCNDDITNSGAAFELNYVDPNPNTLQGGMDGYTNGAIGGFQNGGTWYPSDASLTGMPILLSNLDDSMILQWKVSQDNAWDEDSDTTSADKWMASINMVFDSGDWNEKPDNDLRHYDVVIMSNSYNFKSELIDTLPDDTGNKRSYFARNGDDLRTFDIVVEGKTYQYAVRYKFYYNSGDARNDKVHVKFIPIDKNNVPPYLNHSVKAFIDSSKAYLKFTQIPDDRSALVEEKVADPTLYLKSIRAGYEVYKGESTLRNDYFRIILP